MNLKDLIKKLNMDGSKKNYTNILILVLVGILLVIGSSIFKSSTPTVAKENDKVSKISTAGVDNINTKEYESALGNELKNVLQQIKGIGRVEVIVYCESGEEQVPAFNNNETTSNTTEKATDGSNRNITQKSNGSTIVVTTEGGDNKALILKKNKPKVTGVFIVAEGAEDKIIELQVSKAVASLYDVPENKVNVFSMKK
jgi:stage III sporulation protein AG